MLTGGAARAQVPQRWTVGVAVGWPGVKYFVISTINQRQKQARNLFTKARIYWPGCLCVCVCVCGYGYVRPPDNGSIIFPPYLTASKTGSPFLLFRLLCPPPFSPPPRTTDFPQWAANLNAPGYVGQFSGHRREGTDVLHTHTHRFPFATSNSRTLGTAKICHTSYMPGHAPCFHGTTPHRPQLPAMWNKALYMRHCQPVKCDCWIGLPLLVQRTFHPSPPTEEDLGETGGSPS